jgi:hypothetical protein
MLREHDQLRRTGHTIQGAVTETIFRLLIDGQMVCWFTSELQHQRSHIAALCRHLEVGTEEEDGGRCTESYLPVAFIRCRIVARFHCAFLHHSIQ